MNNQDSTRAWVLRLNAALASGDVEQIMAVLREHNLV